MVQRRSQKRKAVCDDNINSTARENLALNPDDTFLSPPRQDNSMAVFDFKSPSSDPSIDDSSPSIPIVSFYKTTQNQKGKNVLAATENISNNKSKRLTDGMTRTPCKRLRPSYLSEEAITSLTKSPALILPVSAKTPNIQSTKGVKDWSPMRADDVIHASTPGYRKKLPGLTDIKDIVLAVTSDSPVRKFGSDTSDSENDESLAEVAKKQPRKELFSVGRSPDGKYSSKFYSKILSPKKILPGKRTLTPDVIPGKRFFKHRKCSSESKVGKTTSISVGKGFVLKFTPHGPKPNAAKQKTKKSSSARKATRKSRFSKLEFKSDFTKSGEEIVRFSCATPELPEESHEEKGDWNENDKTDEVVAQSSNGEGNGEKSCAPDNSSVGVENINSSISVSPPQSESVPASRCSVKLSSSTASCNPISQIIEGFGFDDEDPVHLIASPAASMKVEVAKEVTDGGRDVKSPTEEVDDGWSTQSVASSSDLAVSSKADSGNGKLTIQASQLHDFQIRPN
jgi:hypothetical protein